MVAEALRRRILSGDLEDGAMLPKQEEMLTEFRVSLPPIREALRILETEGLITVQRGNVGGAVVHRPQAGKAAYMLAMVLQSRGATLGDVQNAIRKLEPACAAACAAREDRASTVLPQLRAVLDEAMAAIDNADAYIGLARQFHVELVASCGNETMRLIIGALESLWSAQVDALARTPAKHGSFANKKVRLKTAEEHEALYEAIAAGDERAAERAAREHFSETLDRGDKRHGFGFESVVDATSLRHT